MGESFFQLSWIYPKGSRTLSCKSMRDGQILKGEGDNTALRLLAEANGQDASFYGFYRSLQAYRETMRNEDTTMITFALTTRTAKFVK